MCLVAVCTSECLTFFSFDSDALLFSTLDIGYSAAILQVGKICEFNQSNALVLIATCKIFFKV